MIGRDFDFLAESIASDFRVICPDMPGRGESDWYGRTVAIQAEMNRRIKKSQSGF